MSITLGGLDQWRSTSIPDEYVRVLFPAEGTEFVLPGLNEDWSWDIPDGAELPPARVYTISDHRVVEGDIQVDIDVVLHNEGLGSDWAKTCEPGDPAGIITPHGLYGAPGSVRWQLLVCDLTGVPAAARILRNLEPGQQAVVHVVIEDPADEIVLPSPADVTVTWEVVDHPADISEALVRAATERIFPSHQRYVWFAGEARASRAVRKHLRRELGWPQSQFTTCGYWQQEAEAWRSRFEEVADQVIFEAEQAQESAAGDEGLYLDALDDIYERAGL